MKEIVVALAGNPNSGKTTMFNALTGSRQHVGNYPGVTVEKKTGTAALNGTRFTVVDLPGTYSLSAASPEEVVARDFLVHEKPDVVVQILDASNLERNLFLATQLLELDVKLVFALNMADVAESKGIRFDLDRLSARLGAPIVPTVGNRKTGMDDLLRAVTKAAAAEGVAARPDFGYPQDLNLAIDSLADIVKREEQELAREYQPRWLAARLVEGDADILSRLKSPKLRAEAERLRLDSDRQHGDMPEIRMAGARYGWITGVCADGVRREGEAKGDVSDRIDSVLLHRVLGLPIFMLLMYLVFQLVFTLADPAMGWIENRFGELGAFVSHLWPKSADSPLRDLLVDGVIGGVGGVLVFLPNIILLFLAIAFLEGTGYMARAAFIMDRIMNRIGLHGKSFIPMLLGFGCTVPAIMGTRTLENRRDRFTTILVLPFMSCGARLPIYTLIIPAFFPEALQAWMLWLVYFIGIAFAIVGAKILRSTLFRGEAAPFVMELPPYRLPTVRSVILLMWDRAGEYCKKAGTIILGVSIVLWAMTAYPKKEQFDRDYEKEAETARAEHLDGIKQLGAGLDLAQGGGLMAEWEEAVLAKNEAEESHWESEPGYAKAAEVFAGESGSLYARDGGGTLQRFAEAVAAVDAIETEFAEKTAELEEGSPGLAAAEKERDAAIAALGLDGELEKAVETYRTGLRQAYADRMTGIADAESGEQLAYSISGRIGRTLLPVLRPIGFDWRVGTAIIGSFAAKEVFVAQMGIVYSVGEADEESESLRSILKSTYSPLQAFCMMIYCLLSAPCVATIAVTRRETGSWAYALGMLIGLTLVAYATTFIVFQLGTLLGIGTAIAG